MNDRSATQNTKRSEVKTAKTFNGLRSRPVAALVCMMVTGTVLPTNVSAQNTELEEVVVTGIRSSLQRAQDIKRNSDGIVDAISAEDIGVFPDTNLAESLQRITGVSIDRSRGEGKSVTVRGLGPQFNLVTLNGRQMPTYADSNDSSGRSFDFGDLASEGISGVQVYKTGRADVPTGGIGSTINITTTKPLESPGLKSVVSVKAVNDQSTDEGSSITPEVSGIYSNTFADDKFGIALSASYQERDSGLNEANVFGWRSFAGDQQGDWGNVPIDANQINRPGAGDIYSVPQQVGYKINEFSRERLNGQLTMQWQATEQLRATVDYTYSEVDLTHTFDEYSAWFNFGAQSTEFDGANVATPVVYTEDLLNQDFTIKAGKDGRTTENNSLGFNLNWQASDRLTLELDYHDSTAEFAPNNPNGSTSQLAASAFTRDQTTLIIDGDLPILNLGLRSAPTPDDFIITGSVFENVVGKMDLSQTKASGTFDLNDNSRLNFGVQMTEVNSRTASSVVQRNDWGGVSQVGDIADLLTQESGENIFDQVSGSTDPRRQFDFFTFDLDALARRTEQLGVSNSTEGDCGTGLCASSVFTTDRTTKEDSTSIYLSYSTDLSIGDMPLAINTGLRYEETDVESFALVPTYSSIVQEGFNEFPVVPALDANGNAIQDFTTLTGEYDVLLPSFDAKLSITDNLEARFSYSETITRPAYAQIQGGVTIDLLTRVNGTGTGTAGNPALLPFESANIDLSLEYYLNDTDYIAVGYFTKDITNFIEEGFISGQVLFPNLIHPATGRAAEFTVATSVNGSEDAKIDGVELAFQKTFGETGFGVIANATLVDGDKNYDSASLGDQFALTDVSDSANLIGFYENEKLQVRLAYNWRDEFLAGIGQSNVGEAGPTITDSYGQWDLSASYNVSDQLTVFFEGINVTEETTNTFGRSNLQILNLSQTGARYNIGARYSF